jgi:hypothetical protein
MPVVGNPEQIQSDLDLANHQESKKPGKEGVEIESKPISPEPKIAEHRLKPIIFWEAVSVVHHEKSRLWYILAATFVLLAIIYFIFTDAASGAVAVIMLAGVYFLAINEKPRVIKVEINDLGIKVKDNFYAFSSIRFFWIIYNPPFTVTLNFATVGRIGRIITVQLGKQDPAEVRNFLRTQVPEVEGKSEGFFESVGKVLRI